MSLMGDNKQELNDAYVLMREYLKNAKDKGEAVEDIMTIVSWALKELL